MSVKADRPPEPLRIIRAIDETAQHTTREAQAAVLPIVSAETPRGRTGKVGKALRPRLGKTSTGYTLTIRAPRGTVHDSSATVSEVVRWLTRGTGIYREGGGPKAPIRPKRRWRPGAAMILPGGKRVRKVRGQKPNPFIGRIYRRANPVVERTFASGADDAARAVARTLR